MDSLAQSKREQAFFVTSKKMKILIRINKTEKR